MIEINTGVEGLNTDFPEPDYDQIKTNIGTDRWDYIADPILYQMFESPSVMTTRRLMLSLLTELSQNPSEAKSLNLPYAYSDNEIEASITIIKAWGTMFGLITKGEVIRIENGENIPLETDLQKKYIPQDKLELPKQQGKTIGLVHGTFDPQHIGHAQLFKTVKQYCDYLMVGFDPNWLVKKLKGNNRPRFPQLAWRMLEVASLPFVDGVFVLPLKGTEDEEYLEIYKRLGVQVLGAGDNNTYNEKYTQRMNKLGGQVIAPPPTWSSTEMQKALTNKRTGRRSWMNFKSYHKQADQIQIKALKIGFLHDYSDNTNKKPIE